VYVTPDEEIPRITSCLPEADRTRVVLHHEGVHSLDTTANETPFGLLDHGASNAPPTPLRVDGQAVQMPSPSIASHDQTAHDVAVCLGHDKCLRIVGEQGQDTCRVVADCGDGLRNPPQHHDRLHIPRAT
jgi:hypothetical protein